MSSSHEHKSWFDRNWQVLVILYALLFVTCLVSFNPVN